LESLEGRTLLSAYVVTTTADSGPGSLRDALNQTNADVSHTLYPSPGNPNVDEIDFAITAGSDTGGGYNATTGVATIKPQSGLPGITSAVMIDAWSQPGFAGTPLIELNGAGAGSAPCLFIQAPDTTVRGLVINRFAGGGIAIFANNTWIAGNYIGTDPTGTINEGNGGGIGVNDGAGRAGDLRPVDDQRQPLAVHAALRRRFGIVHGHRGLRRRGLRFAHRLGSVRRRRHPRRRTGVAQRRSRLLLHIDAGPGRTHDLRHIQRRQRLPHQSRDDDRHRHPTR
jgi:hypothetical protein